MAPATADRVIGMALGRGKTDQEGRGAVIAIIRGDVVCPVAALRDWLDAAAIPEGPLFRPVRRGSHVQAERLTDRSVANIVKTHAERRRVGPGPTLGPLVARRLSHERSQARCSFDRLPGVLVLELYRAQIAERGVEPAGVVERSLRTPTGPPFARFFIGIILGLVAEFAFIEPSKRLMMSSFAARRMDRKRIVGRKFQHGCSTGRHALTLNF
jgi:hypothetical protein